MMFEQAPGAMALLEGADYHFSMANAAFFQLAGKRGLIGRPIADALPELDSQGFRDLLISGASAGEPFVCQAMPMRVSAANGAAEDIYVDFIFQPLRDGAGGNSGILVQGSDVSRHERAEALRAAHTGVLEMAVADCPLEKSLGELIRIIESTSRTGVLGSILLLDEDGRHLRHGAAPSLPELYCAAIDGAEIGPKAGSCGTAAYTAQPVLVADIATDPLWEEFSEFALSCGLRACWSTPIITSGRKVLGTFAMYHREPREPTVRDLALVDLVTQTAALIIDRDRARRSAA